MKHFISVEEAYTELARGIADFAGGRRWNVGVCECSVYQTMASAKCWIQSGDVIETAGLDWPDTSIDKGGAALFLRDDLLRTTGARIWGLTFTLYPDGKFSIEYDYNKPEGYEETVEVITGDEINQSLGGLADPQK